MPEIGGAAIAAQSGGSSGPSSPSPGSSSSPRGSVGEASAVALTWATFGTIVYAWLGTSKLDNLPSWAPLVALVVNALPGGQVGDILKSLGLALVDKLPGRSGGK